MAEALLQILDQAFRSSAERSGAWLVCRPGCSQCCHGVFAISAMDAERLRTGLVALREGDAARADRIAGRVADAVERLAPGFPGDSRTGVLGDSDEDAARFEEFANDEPCPVLDPLTQTCDLYANRPVLCRTFGPPLVTPDGNLAMCELCFEGAPAEEIERCQMDPAVLTAEAEAEIAFDEAGGKEPGKAARQAAGPTIIAFALRGC